MVELVILTGDVPVLKNIAPPALSLALLPEKVVLMILTGES